MRANLRAIVRGAYDIQDMRIRTGGRLVANLKVKLGQAPGEKEDGLGAEAKELLAKLRLEYDKITDGAAVHTLKLDKIVFPEDGLISEYAELCIAGNYFSMSKQEHEQFQALKKVVERTPLWEAFLEGVCGIGPAMAGVILSEIDPTVSRYPSSLWAYAGLDVGGDGRGRSKRKEHLVDKEYKDKSGKLQTKKSITYNPWLKTKLMGVLATSFLRVGPEKSPYAKIYYDYKHRMESHATHGTHNDKIKDPDGKLVASKGHRHAMAMRYMIKMFLVDLYKAWRPLVNLPVHPPYEEAKLGHVHTA